MFANLHNAQLSTDMSHFISGNTDEASNDKLVFGRVSFLKPMKRCVNMYLDCFMKLILDSYDVHPVSTKRL